MSKVFFSVAMSVDGYIAPQGMAPSHDHEPNPLDWMDRWKALHEVQRW